MAEEVVEIDCRRCTLPTEVLQYLLSGVIAAIRVCNLFSPKSCKYISDRLLASNKVVRHDDVEGLRVLSYSHFQAVRDKAIGVKYREIAHENSRLLRSFAEPYSSPFDVALGFIAGSWTSGCSPLTLPTEGRLSPFTIRIYGDGVGIEPHQDVLGAESPVDDLAMSIHQQLGANIYLSTSDAGGELEIFEMDLKSTKYENLDDGPKVIDRGALGAPIAKLRPKTGDLILFSSRRVHAVTPVVGDKPRITVSFFMGTTDRDSCLSFWA